MYFKKMVNEGAAENYISTIPLNPLATYGGDGGVVFKLTLM